MTLDERIEAARRAYPRLTVSMSRDEAQTVLRAAFPELFTDPPTAWIAPWEADEGMAKQSQFFTPHENYRAMRDHHLSQGK